MAQPGLSNEEKILKLGAVLDAAMAKISQVLASRRYDRFPVHATYQPTSEQNGPFSDYGLVKEKLSKAKLIKNDPKLQEELEFFSSIQIGAWIVCL